MTLERGIDAVSQRVTALLNRAGDIAGDPIVIELRDELSTCIEELCVAAEDIELKSHELLLAENREQEQRVRNADIFALAPEAYIETDLNGVITHVNDKACGLLEVPERFVGKKPLVSFVSNDDRHLLRKALNDLGKHLFRSELTVRLCSRDGNIRRVELLVIKRLHVSGAILLWRVRDLSSDVERDRRFVELFEQLEVARSAAGLSQVLMSEDHALESILSQLTSLASLATGAIASTVCLLSDQKTCRIDEEFYWDLHAEQIKHDGGPSVEAMRTNRLIEVPYLDLDDRWPFMHEPASRLAVHAVLAVPLRADGECVGALTVFGKMPEMFTDNDVEVLHALGSQAAFATSNLRLYQAASDLATGLEIAMQNRSAIEQAKGMIMLREKCTSEEAFTVLRKMSQTHNVKLRDLAQSLLESVTSGNRSNSVIEETG